MDGEQFKELRKILDEAAAKVGADADRKRSQRSDEDRRQISERQNERLLDLTRQTRREAAIRRRLQLARYKG
jgi:hypothetical protein